jgi:hypothetical protein
MADSGDSEKSEKSRKSKWLWPAGVMATSLAGAALLLLRGCWHRKMSWPVRMQGCAYQVCLGCGAKQLFDEKNFRSYGPFRYDLNELIAWQRLQRLPTKPEAEQQRPAS